MIHNGKRLDSPDLSLYFQNRPRYPNDELQHYVGRHIAWSADGLLVLASGETVEEMERQLNAAGIDPSQVIGDFVPPLDLILF